MKLKLIGISIFVLVLTGTAGIAAAKPFLDFSEDASKKGAELETSLLKEAVFPLAGAADKYGGSGKYEDQLNCVYAQVNLAQIVDAENAYRSARHLVARYSEKSKSAVDDLIVRLNKQIEYTRKQIDGLKRLDQGVAQDAEYKPLLVRGTELAEQLLEHQRGQLADLQKFRQDKFGKS